MALSAGNPFLFGEPPERPQKKEMELLFDTEPIVGWRVWRLGRGNAWVDVKTALALAADAIDKGDSKPIRDLSRFHLIPLAHTSTPWPAGKRHEAKCNNNDYQGPAAIIALTTGASANYLAGPSPSKHTVPHALCHCGSWAVKEHELAGAIQNYASSLKRIPFVVGEVSLWGHIVEETKGWRAQYAYPKSLTVVNGTGEHLEDIAALYGVPTVKGEWREEWTPPKRESNLDVKAFAWPAAQWTFTTYDVEYDEEEDDTEYDPPKKKRWWK